MDGTPGGHENTAAEGAVAGRVTVGGRPQAEATVTIVQAQATHPDLAAFSNEDGEYQLPGLSPGWYEIEARLGERSARQRVVLAPGEQAHLDLALD